MNYKITIKLTSIPVLITHLVYFKNKYTLSKRCYLHVHVCTCSVPICTVYVLLYIANLINNLNNCFEKKNITILF